MTNDETLRAVQDILNILNIPIEEIRDLLVYRARKSSADSELKKELAFRIGYRLGLSRTDANETETEMFNKFQKDIMGIPGSRIGLSGKQPIEL